MATSVRLMQQRYFTGFSINNNQYPLVHERKHTPSLQDESTITQGTVNEALKEAALINIVAAVNDHQTGDATDKLEITAAPGSAIDSLSNTMAVISNLMNARRRTVSIPRTAKVQDLLNLQHNTIQRKPVYYKHSDDEEVLRREQHLSMCTSVQRIADYNLNSRAGHGPQDEKKKPSKEVIIKSLPTRPHAIEYNIMHNTNHSTSKTRTSKTRDKEHDGRKTRESESRNSVRRLGSLKRTEPRKVHRLAKCDAVDLSETDTSANLQEIFKVLNVNQQKGSDNRNPKHDIKYYRTKSLPVMYPSKSKTARSNTASPGSRTQTSAIRGRHLSQSMTQRTPDSLYKRALNMPCGFGFEKLAICNGLNQDPDIVSPVAYDSRKSSNSKQTFPGIVNQKSHWKQRTSKTPNQSFRGITSDEDMESDGTTGKAGVFFTESDHDFRDAVKHKLNGGTGDTHYEEVIYSVTPTAQGSTASGLHRDRHVQFLRRRFLSDSSDESIGEEEKLMEDDKEAEVTHYDTRMIHAPVSTSVAYPPISANQLLRIQQKVIPANIKTGTPALQPFFTTTSGIKLQKVERQKSDMSKSFVKCDDDADKIEIKVTQHIIETDPKQEPEITIDPPPGGADVLYESDTEFTELRDIASSPIGRELSTAASKTHPDTSNSDRKSDNSFYKLVRAVDTHAYAEFEHKKLRRLAPGVCGKAQDNQTTEFVKIKL